MAMVLAHVSDLHVSRFGEHVTSLSSRKTHGRAAPRSRGPAWEVVEIVDEWRIERRTEELRLVDDAGKVHQRRRVQPADAATLQQSFAAMVRERTRTAHDRLAANLPDANEVERLLVEDPTNTNLLFLRAARILVEDAPDWVLLTGDLTDDGVGYDLILAALAPFIERGRLLAVPGNHDVYDSPMFVVPAHARKRRTEKLAAWRAFAAQLGLPDAQYWLRELGEGALVCGLDSCNPALTPISASGAILTQTLRELTAALPPATPADCRIAMLHHHVVNPPVRAVGSSPWQLGMRLRNARTVYETLRELQFRCVLNGHRHVGYRYHPSHAPMFISAPSATLGCRSGSTTRPFYWRIEVRDGDLGSVRERTL
ncbi:MAG: 3,5-cyclic-nucleotide phosphodiesterase [Myxococcales bacterium]|nr:3,5-cyclic-nucleotide phosphodiesterase [Myxococcales bacterium]